MEKIYPALGLDIAKAKIDCALYHNGKIKSKVVQNTQEGFAQLSLWLNKQGIDKVHACCEATNVYWEAIAYYLFEKAHRISVVNPARIQAYAQSRMVRGKTDKQDANLIALFCDREQPDLWNPPLPTERALLALVRDLQTLEDMALAENNRLLVAHEAVKPRILRHLDWLNQEIKRLRKQIKDSIDQDPSLKESAELLKSIPGIGEKTIPWLLSMLSNGKRFERSKQAAAFVGLSPRQWESGSSVRGKTRISKTGHAELRRILYMPAVVAFSRLTTYQNFVQRLKNNGKPPKVIIVALMRKLICIAQAILKYRTPFNQIIYQNACKT